MSLRRGDVRRMVDELLAARGPTVAAHARDALRLVLRLQVERDVLEVNVAAGVRAPAHLLRPPRFLTPEEAERLQAVADADAYAPIGPLVALAPASGLRESELLGLVWGVEGLDLEARLARVRRARDRSTGVVTPKTGRPRDVPLGPQILSRMLRHRLVLGRPREASLVFPARPAHAWPRVRRSAKLADPQPRFHDLRHATFWLAAGLRSRAVAELLGHRNAGLVDRLYGHALPDEVASARTVLEAWLAARRGAQRGCLRTTMWTIRDRCPSRWRTETGIAPRRATSRTTRTARRR